MNIHFICRGNVLRSLMAETYLRSLGLKNINVISSGTNANWNDKQEREYFANTLAVLERHGIKQFAKTSAQKLTQERLNNSCDIVVLMNQRVVDEAAQLFKLPDNIYNWEIVDIGEGDRTDNKRFDEYPEEIYQEIVSKVDSLVKERNLNNQ